MAENGGFRENSDFSLDLRQIRPSAVFGTRRRTALRGEGFAWVPDLGSFLKLRQVGVSPYLSLILILSVLRMFELNEVVRGRLIGSKSWNRGVRFWKPTWTACDCPRADLGGGMLHFVINHVLVWKRPGMAARCGFTK